MQLRAFLSSAAQFMPRPNFDPSAGGGVIGLKAGSLLLQLERGLLQTGRLTIEQFPVHCKRYGSGYASKLLGLIALGACLNQKF